MDDTTAIAAPPDCRADRAKPYVGKNANPRYAALYRHYPTIAYLRRDARRHVPHFAFEYTDGGAGKDDAGIAHNWAGARCRRTGAALRRDAGAAAGRRRTVRPPICGADRHRADGRPGAGVAGRGSNIWRAPRSGRACPICSARSAASTIEEIAELAPDVFWFQLYRAAAQRPRHRLRSGAPRRKRRAAMCWC